MILCIVLINFIHPFGPKNTALHLSLFVIRLSHNFVAALTWVYLERFHMYDDEQSICTCFWLDKYIYFSDHIEFTNTHTELNCKNDSSELARYLVTLLCYSCNLGSWYFNIARYLSYNIHSHTPYHTCAIHMCVMCGEEEKKTFFFFVCIVCDN